MYITDPGHQRIRFITFLQSITSFTPVAAGTGEIIYITGTNLQSATAVKFGVTPAASFTVNSFTEIAAVVGAGSTGSVSVTTSSTTLSKTGFTYVPAPTITSFTPTAASTGQTVNITGTNFTGASSVTFGGVASQSYTVNSSTSISAVVGMGTNGSVAVTTTGGTATLAGFTMPVPTITSFTPTTTYVGGTVTITGTNLLGVNQVTFGNVTATSFNSTSTTITAVVGNGATGSVAVFSQYGNASKTGFVLAAPVITSFSPTSGSNGSLITISGNNMAGASNVKFGVTNASTINSVSNTSVTATVGLGSSGSVSLTTPGGTATLAGFTFTGPTVTSFAPTSAFQGNTVTITGTNFTDASAVTFGGVPAQSFVVNSATSISAIVGPGSSGSIVVTTPTGSSSLAGFTFTGPKITSFSPASSGTGTTVGISGSNLSGATSVTFGGTPATSFSIINSTQVNAIVGAGTTGVVSITTPNGTAVSSGTFTYLPAAEITSFSPQSGGAGTVVTITGNNFTGVTLVKFGTINASSFTVINSTTINATVGSGSSGSVSVTNGGGTGSLAGFTFVPAPTITNFSPTSAGTGTTVSITGTNFSTATDVSLGGVAASSFTVVSATNITAVVANGATGNVTVKTLGGTANAGTFIFIPAPTVTSFTPLNGATNASVTITGTNFRTDATVMFGGVPANSMTFGSATTLYATVGAGASGNVSVTTPGGTASLAGFTYNPPPVITSFSPSNVVPGSVVTLTGTNFTGVNSVALAGTSASSFTIVSPTEITAVVHPNAGNTTAISLNSPTGTGTATGLTCHNFYSFSPTSATYGQTVTLYGYNLTPTTAASFGGVPATSITTFTTNMQAVVGFGNTGSISISTPGGPVTRTGFTYIVPPPTISSFTPTSAANRSMVTITGNQFNGTTLVKFGTVPAYSFTIVNNNTIEAIVGAGGTDSVVVVTPGGRANKSGFTYIPTAPTINSFSPASACSTGTLVTIRGLNFVGATSVQMNGVPVSYTYLSDTVITVATGSVNNSGLISVVSPYGTATSTTNFVYGSGVTAFLPNPSPFQLCGGVPRQLTDINLPGAFTLSMAGHTEDPIVLNTPGSYSLMATDEYGCSGTSTFTVTNYSNCGGYLTIESEPVINYFDTLHVKVKIKNGVNIFGTYAYLNFNPAQLKYVSSEPGDYLGNNIFYQPAVVTGGQIDFGMNHITGDPGTYGDGLIYTFTFVLADQIPSSTTFNEIKPNFFTSTLTLDHLNIYDVSGVKPPSFAAISMLTKPIACRYYVPVWPGDLNFDKRVNVADILPIGYFYLGTGSVRPNSSLQFTPQPSALWGFDKTTKKKSAYMTFADGTPDGIINLADLTSIGFNLSRNHAKFVEAPVKLMETSLQKTADVPSIFVNMPDAVIQSSALPMNETMTINIGSAATPLNNLYGIAFDIFFNPAAVNLNAITTNYSGSIFGTLGTNFTRIEDKTALSSGRLSIGITRYGTTNINATGGSAVSITLPLLASAPGGLFKVKAVPLGCNDNLGNDLPVTGSTDTLIINTTNPCLTNYWQGTVSDAWENAENWSCGTVPDVNTNVYINTLNPYFPKISSMAVCKTMNTGADTKIIIKTGFKLDIKQ